MMDDVINVRSKRIQKEFLRNYAKSKGYANISRAVREIIDEKMSAEAAEGEKRSEPAQPYESDLIKEIFELLNKGAKPWEVVEKVGDIGLVERCYKKMKEWMDAEEARNLEKCRVLREKEEWQLSYYLVAFEDYIPPEKEKYIRSVLERSRENMMPPSEIISRDLGKSFDEFINEIDREIDKKFLEEP